MLQQMGEDECLPLSANKEEFIVKRCSIVIGSLWGDEGKGHMTDILCNSNNTLNVRFNGGAQASHTVVTPEGKRHAFRTFGSGTFTGANTYLSEDFVVNTMAFFKERNELINEFNITPCEFVNPNCIVSTLWDIYINQAIETMREDNRHGSCGFGINETVERSKNLKYKITVMDLLSKNKLTKKLLDIENEYIQMRLKKEYNLSIYDLPEEYIKLISDKENVDMFLFYANEFISNVQIRGNDIINRFENVVFEGAQGLLLDQNNSDYFPHVTTSNTGIKNVMNILKELNSDVKLDIYYMSRCYITRHGAGPFKNEIKGNPYTNVSDLTNVPNEFQGALRFGYLDFDLLTHEISKDLRNLTVPANVNVTFICLDQVDNYVKYLELGRLKTVKSDEFLNVAWSVLSAKICGLYNVYATEGLTRDYIVSYK